MTTVNTWALLLAAVACEVTAALSLKGALDHSVLYVPVAAGYLASFALLSLILSRGFPLGVLYGIWGALGVASTAVLSALIFDESLTGITALGLALVIAGVLTVEIGSQAAARRHEQATS